ncbi:hypothetical protein GN156_03930 [bacterium LRH843]|nr:hypothetical protein [bacterium LRH843]
MKVRIKQHLIYYREKISNNSVTWFVSGMFLYLILLISITFMAPSSNHLINIAKNIPNYGLILQLTKQLIPFFNQTLLFILPVSAAFFYFTYREQTSISSRRQNGFSLFIFILITVCFLLTGHLLNFFLSAQMSLNTSYHKSFLNLFILWIIMLLFSLYFLIKIVNYSLTSINTSKLLLTNRKKFTQYLEILYHTKKPKHNDVFFKLIIDSMETTFQGLSYSLSNGLSSVFDRHFKSWGSSLNKLMEETPNNHKSDKIFIKRLIDIDTNQANKFYELLIRNQGVLISQLNENQKYNELNTAIKTFEQLEPTSVPELYKQFFLGLEEFCINIYSKDDFPFETLLESLRNLSFSLPSTTSPKDLNILGTTLIHQTLIKMSVERNHMKSLASISDSISKLSNKAPVFLESKSKVESTMQIQSFLQNQLNSQIMVQGKDITLFVLVQGLLKSVEIGAYSSTGFLIKRITTNFSGKEINDVAHNFLNHSGDFSSFYSSKIKSEGSDSLLSLSDLDTNFHFNEQSFKYCLQKMFLLIFLQEKFIIENNLVFTEFHKKDKEFLDINLFDSYYVQYVIKKVKHAGDRYGLLSVSDNIFLNNITKTYFPK